MEAWERAARAVRRRRAELGLRQDDVAAAGRVSISTVSGIERAARANYRMSKLAAVSRGLQWPPDAIEGIVTGRNRVHDDGSVDLVVTGSMATDLGGLSATIGPRTIPGQGTMPPPTVTTSDEERLRVIEGRLGRVEQKVERILELLDAEEPQ